MTARRIEYYLLILGLTFFSALISTDGRYKQRILGGRFAKRNQFPYITSLCRRSIGAPKEDCIIRRCRHICGATIIHKEWLITSKTCFDVFTTEFHIVAGILIPFETSGDIQIRRVTKIVHSGNDSFLKDNISLVRVHQAFKINVTVGIIKLPKADTVYGSSSYIMGYGVTRPKDRYFVTRLHYMTAPILSLSECREMIRRNPVTANMKISDKYICTYPQPNETACEGDTGGPLVSGNILLGIITITIGDCTQVQFGRFINLYTRVSNYLSFIHKVLKDRSVGYTDYGTLD
ncbi:hypothetical protein ILUMI_02509 [Ignelater luminosus]|uniref:Peptidase S1 domain-containing protein n=1 Tax=Ignelater luminosus TaxID=2038154 RepID=A0A8K0DCL3_IGNLU|nr:hypothetical protein ILUMI_02509 [Ignelater luminosus]